jgi:hypothetical protein
MGLRLAAALALDLEARDEFHGVMSQLVGDSLSMNDASSYSSWSMILAHPDLSVIFGEDVIQRREDIPDADLLWVLRVLAERNDINVRAIASLALERGLLSPMQKRLLEQVRDRGDLPVDVLSALTRAAAGVLKKEDLGSFGRWYDVESEPLLLAILVMEDDPELLQEAFEVLSGKSLMSEPAASLVDWVRRNAWEDRNSFAKAVGVFGSLEFVDQGQIEKAFDVFDNFVKDTDLLDILLDSKSPVLSRLVIERYSKLLGLGALLGLLNDPDPKTRIAALRAMKGFNDVGALKIIIDHYEKEKDPEVRAVYQQTFWMIRERENAKK